MKQLTEQNKSKVKIIPVYLVQLPCGDIILHNYKNGSAIVKTSDFVSTYTAEEMKEIYNYPLKNII